MGENENINKWTEIIIRAPSGALETAEAALHMATPLGLYIEDYSDLEATVNMMSGIDLIEDVLLQKDRNSALLHVYFPPDRSPAECAGEVRGCLNRAGFAEGAARQNPDEYENVYTIASVNGIDEEDWANNWKRYFKPLRVGKGILVRPEWIETEEIEASLLDGVTAIVSVDPGMAFGTGSHASTRLCLELLEEYAASAQPDFSGSDALDLGCGSGILSIAAAALGARSATGADIDKYAVRNAAANAGRNGFSDRIKFSEGDLLNGITGRYHVILANIAADVIIRLLGGVGSPDIARFLHPDGAVILSGIIHEREDEVINAAAKRGFTVSRVLRAEGWTAFMLKYDE